jgi:sensor histidine kinase YesM
MLGRLILGYPPLVLSRYLSVRTSAMMGFTLMVACCAVLLFIGRERLARIKAEAAEERARAAAIERGALQARLQLLQAQVEPHMLFNTLANLQGLIAIDPGRASAMLDQLIQYLRATLSSSRSETTTLARECALIEAYLGLMSVRMGSRLSYRLQVPESLRQARMAPMLLQPLVENAIIHGIEPNVAGGRIEVTACQRGALLELTVADSGLGLDGGAGTAGTGLGLANTRERLRVLFGEGAGLDLEPGAVRGAVARLTLPLEIA